jgi:hypothetical protein
LLPSLLFPCIASILIMTFIDISGYLEILLWGAIYLVSFVVPVWIFGLTAREKEIVTTPVKNITKKIISKLLRF